MKKGYFLEKLHTVGYCSNSILGSANSLCRDDRDASRCFNLMISSYVKVLYDTVLYVQCELCLLLLIIIVVFYISMNMTNICFSFFEST